MSITTLFPIELSHQEIGIEIHNFAKKLWPINRSITGEGVRNTLKLVKEHVPQLIIEEIATGTQVFDWVIPQEWIAREAWLKTPAGQKICNFSDNNLHLLGYSIAANKTVSKEELEEILKNYKPKDEEDLKPLIKKKKLSLGNIRPVLI